MGQMSELEKFLQEQIADVDKESSGKFTLSREKALEKLAAFQFPRPTAWVLKVLQAVYASGAADLTIRQSQTDTQFYFRPQSEWSLNEIETEFYNPESSPKSDLNHLKRALWGPGLNDMKPFRLSLPNVPEALVWDGRDLCRQPCLAQDLASLTMSHRSFLSGRGMMILRNIEAARCNADILEELRNFAYVYPIPLQVDQRRLDGLYACPSQGSGAENYPIHLVFAQAPTPPMSFPRGALEVTSVTVAGPMQANAACLLAAHFRRVERGKKMVWETPSRWSSLRWVVDGVIVDSDDLPVPASPISCSLFASAEGLATDLSGFRLQRNQAQRERVQQLVEVFAPALSQVRFSLDSLIEQKRETAKLASSLLVAGGVMVAFFSPLHSLGMFIGAAVNYTKAGSSERELERILQSEFRNWQSAWGKPGGSRWSSF